MHLIVPLALAALTHLGPDDPPTDPVGAGIALETWALLIGAVLILMLFAGRHLRGVARE
ncbi:hypothetical protein SCOR_30850 [Sulfidibacter corallicola]|uniref:Uncharacterized protein n=1 Tax=Sulfidibacter corallicola TaxID=2818388 RepID=A0A8A4TJ44_SULCO|nr:hypothetical protein [Sulfidibacter corallicola]QTD50049.1 hypothetical protein J3U87_31075 [Sulfidibacter corallicola]